MSPDPRPPSPTSPSQANRTGCRSRSRSPSWCCWCCWWCTATRSPCCCRWRRSATAFVTAQAAVAGVSDLFGIGVSNQSMIFLSAMIAGAGTDYAVFLISRYHDYLRQGADVDDAVKQALISIGKVITASAATVGVTFIGLSFAKMGVFSTIGVACAIAVGVAFLAAMTLLPAILVSRRAARLGQTPPRTHGPVLATLGGTYRATAEGPPGRQPARAGHSRRLRGLGELQLRRSQGARARRRRARSGTPRWNAISRSARPCPSTSSFESPRDLRTPQALADLEQMAQPGQPTAGHRSDQRHDPTHRRGAARSSGRPIRRASSAIGWPRARR